MDTNRVNIENVLFERKKNYDVLVLVKEYCLLCMGGVVCGGLGGRWGYPGARNPLYYFKLVTVDPRAETLYTVLVCPIQWSDCSNLM